MFTQRIYNDQENLEEPNFNPAEFPPSFLSSIPIENFGAEFFPRDDPGFYMPTDFEGYEQNLPFMLDPVIYQSLQEDMKRFMPGFDMFPGFAKEGNIPDMKPTYFIGKTEENPQAGKKIGTITMEERKEKVKKYLEKRKRRIFTKRISYACRKRVADSRIRVKGRFVTKEQARKLEYQIPIKKEEDFKSS
ncbi:hypothetical protein SteCoe_15991 [Stentor coeruleus]|uniref:CCT domain-containing protein n=1 Tax=Stentor coeruleus TaxID=5963 RepID=A0A1R2C292_9CILI|nr:hypothetical protein SteCoe_15991 [Stentor coeruleus]